MQLTSFSVEGFRSLVDVRDIPLRSPTILTGRNDSGKSSLLDALSFLLDGGHKPAATDFPPPAEPPAADERQSLVVTGVFQLSDADREATGLPETVRIRHSAYLQSGKVFDNFYEVERRVPRERRLRDLKKRTLLELKSIAADLGMQQDGPASAKQSYLSVLTPLAEEADTCLDWVDAGIYLHSNLPLFLYRTGIGTADVSGTARKALEFTYREILKRDEFREPVAKLESEIISALAEASQSLCEVIERNCDGLSDVSLVPAVSFKDAVLSGTQVYAYRDGKQVSFEHAGTGRRQQVIQAIWEWENLEIMRSDTADQGAVIAYDEPDVSLDYARQRSFMTQVRDQCETGNVRAIVATHSVQMIDQVPLDGVVHLELTGGVTRLNRVPDGGGHDDISTFIGQLTEELGLSTSSVLFERCFLLVEGKTEKQAFPRFFHLATGQRLQEAGIVVVDAEGNTSVPQLVKCLREMGKPVYVIVDADSKRDRPNLFNREKLLEYGVLPGFIDYLGDVNELEELFSNEQWSDLSNGICPRGNGHSWEPGHFAPLRQPGRKFSDQVKNLLGQSKPDLMTQMARRMSHRDHLPNQLTAAFDRLMETLRNGPHS